MPRELSAFERLDGYDGLFMAHNGKLRCSAIALEDGQLCLFSPVQGLGQEARESLGEIGEVAFLLAPNHYHNKALREYAEAFPAARLCAPQGAIGRLEKITGLELENLEIVESSLMKTMDFVEPAGLKTGEAWLRCRNGASMAWFVVDAFCGPQIRKNQPSSDQPELLKTFPTYGTGDKAAYKAWAQKQISGDKPQALIPCHGAIVQAQDLPAKLEKLLDEAF